MTKKMAVLGAGAIGGTIGGHLTMAGHDITLIDQWPENVETMKSQGLRISGTHGDHQAPVRALHVNEVSILIKVAAEAVRVGQTMGVSVEPINNIPAQAYLDADTGAGMEDVETEMAYRATERGEGLPSLLQDLTKGRSTEIHFLNGYVSDKGKRVGVPTPINQALTSLVTRIEKEGLKPDISNLRFLEPHVS